MDSSVAVGAGWAGDAGTADSGATKDSPTDTVELVLLEKPSPGCGIVVVKPGIPPPLGGAGGSTSTGPSPIGGAGGPSGVVGEPTDGSVAGGGGGLTVNVVVVE